MVDDTGTFALPWPCTIDGAPLDLDLLLMTATSSSLDNGRYASPQKIADAWLREPHRAEYFWKNRQHGIETFQDGEIEALLRREIRGESK